MCGIAGIININKKRTEQASNIYRMTNQMKKRGPDDEGFLLADSENNRISSFFGDATRHEGREAEAISFYPKSHIKTAGGLLSDVALGHRRLSILDLSAAGHQPMCTEDGRYWIVYNGEVYNFIELREELRRAGDSFFSRTDTEVVLKAYRRWGAQALRRFNGMWAFAIWDTYKKNLFCSRDRMGIKPFYYNLTHEHFLFGSDIKTLISSGLYIPEPNMEGVYHALSFYCAPRPMTCFKGIAALEPAHWMSIDIYGNIQKSRFWQIPAGEIDYSKNEEKWAEEVEYKLKESVRRRLIADVPVGTFMSGGIDSTTISAIAAQEHPGIKAFTLSYEKDAPGYEELTQAKATARMYPMQHIIKQVNPEETLQYLIDMVKCYEEPYYSLSPNYIISKLVAENGIKVILNGLGGDELFCGYNRQCLLKLWGWLKSAHLFLKPLPPFNSKLKKLKELSSLADIYEYYLYMFSVFTEDKKHRLFRNISAAWNSYETFKSLYGLNGMKFCEGLEALSYMDLVNYISNHQVYRLDQFTMNFSIEGRLPFLDYEFIELACRIPGRLKVSRGVSKYILRKVSKKLIDPSSLRMKKKGFGLPVDQWINDKLSALTTDCLERLKKRDIFNNAEIDTIYRDHRHYNQSKIWQLVMIELWLEELIEKRISS